VQHGISPTITEMTEPLGNSLRFSPQEILSSLSKNQYGRVVVMDRDVLIVAVFDSELCGILYSS
jgi:hypothetical protein